MTINGIIQRKLALLDSHMLELQRRLEGVDVDQFSGDTGLRWMTERALQIMAEIVIDVAERILAVTGAGPAATAAEALHKLVDLGVLKSAEPYVPVVRFRNVIVHQYEIVDPRIVYNVATEQLDVLRRFRDEVDRYDLQH